MVCANLISIQTSSSSAGTLTRADLDWSSDSWEICFGHFLFFDFWTSSSNWHLPSIMLTTSMLSFEFCGWILLSITFLSLVFRRGFSSWQGHPGISVFLNLSICHLIYFVFVQFIVLCCPAIPLNPRFFVWLCPLGLRAGFCQWGVVVSLGFATKAWFYLTLKELWTLGQFCWDSLRHSERCS